MTPSKKRLVLPALSASPRRSRSRARPPRRGRRAHPRASLRHGLHSPAMIEPARTAALVALQGLSDDLGACWGTDGGRPVAERYGDLRGEHRAVLEGRAFAARSWVDLVEVHGNDRRRFLHGLVTCDVQGLAAGASTFGFVTSVQGR